MLQTYLLSLVIRKREQSFVKKTLLQIRSKSHAPNAVLSAVAVVHVFQIVRDGKFYGQVTNPAHNSNGENMSILNQCSGFAVYHYQTLKETEKAIIISLDGSDYTSFSIPKSQITGETKPRKNIKGSFVTPVTDWFSRKNYATGGAVRIIGELVS